MKYPWALAVTYCDTENNEFLRLGGAAWKTKRERDASLRQIPTATEETDYVLDIESPRGIADDRYLDATTVERLFHRPVAELIAEARRSEAILRASEIAEGEDRRRQRLKKDVYPK